MPDEPPLTTLRPADQARSDYVVETELEVIKAQLALLPNRKTVARVAPFAIIGTIGLVLIGIVVFLALTIW
jgi:hypothetical protein